MPPPLDSVTAYLALGSNLGDREANLHNALDRLGAARGVRVVSVSTFYDNPAVGGPVDSPAFLNAAAVVETTLGAFELLKCLLSVEREMGRERRRKWEPRVIDLDLLLYGAGVVDTPELKVPHPLLHERDFVLKPLAEIAPEATHPVFGRTVAELLASLGGKWGSSAELLRDNDLPCMTCGYNLRGLTAWTDCPECATPVMNTFKEAARGSLRGATRDTDFYRRALITPVAERAGCTGDGVLFVMDAVTQATPPDADSIAALRAADVCGAVKAYARHYFNDPAEARDLLTEWKVTTSEDVGRILFGMADAGLTRAVPGESVRAFDNLFTLETLLGAPGHE